MFVWIFWNPPINAASASGRVWPRTTIFAWARPLSRRWPGLICNLPNTIKRCATTSRSTPIKLIGVWSTTCGRCPSRGRSAEVGSPPTLSAPSNPPWHGGAAILLAKHPAKAHGHAEHIESKVLRHPHPPGRFDCLDTAPGIRRLQKGIGLHKRSGEGPLNEADAIFDAGVAQHLAHRKD